MRGMVLAHMNGVSALIALALGYFVYLLAKKERGLLKTVGYAIGIAIIAISSVIVLGKVLWTAKMCIKMCPLKQSSLPIMSTPAVLPKK